MVDLSLCPFCGSKPETPFENLRDSEDVEDVVKVWTMHHHCRGIDMWIEGNDVEECGENWNRRSGVAQGARDDLGIVLSALRFLEEAVGEDFDDEGGVIAQIERDHAALTSTERCPEDK